MKKLIISLSTVVALLMAPVVVSANSGGYWEPYQTTQRVAVQVPETRYICERQYNFYLGHVNNCFYRTEYVTRFENRNVTKYRWVEARPVVRHVPVRTVPVTHHVPVQHRVVPVSNYVNHNNWNTWTPARTTTSNVHVPSYNTGYRHGFTDASMNRSFDNQRHVSPFAHNYNYYGYSL